MRYIGFIMSAFWIPVLFFIARECIPDQIEYMKMNWRLKL
jgi:hypothetical protein